VSSPMNVVTEEVHMKKIAAVVLLALCGLAISADVGPSWAFTPPKDTFSDDALFDLRSLNEKVAGENGFVTRSKDGNDFLLGNGKPARFWALNDGPGEKVDLARHARFLAKRGINMVRAHTNITPSDGNLMNC